MSYLNPLRLHFSGKFQANVSTVNNDPGHFDNATFLPAYQEMQTAQAANGWFNPQGDAAWRLLGCAVTAAWMPDGSPAVATDPVRQYWVADGDTKVCAKLVDLDPEQQLVSEIWGLQVRITDPAGNTLLRGDFAPAAFADIWDRATGSGGGGDIGAGAMYQSVLTNLIWGDVSASDFLAALKASAGDGLLSIKFNVDGLSMDFTSPGFMCGRLVGTIGPASRTEPRHLVIGRQFLAQTSPKGNFFTPVGGINFFAGIIDADAGAIFLDLGNAITTSAPGGVLNDLGTLTLGVYDPAITPASPTGSVIELGTVPSRGPGGYAASSDWYLQTAGVVRLPLSPDQMAAAENAPLVLYGASGATASESPLGAFVRADDFVFRLSPGDSVEIPVYASKWGRPLANAAVKFTPDASQLQPSNSINPNDVPPVAVPLSALQFNGSAMTGAGGQAVLKVTAGDPDNPRSFIDGQVYGIRPSLDGPQNNAWSIPVNQWNFVSFLVWNKFSPDNPVTWNGCLQPIFQLYANLYPIMKRFMDLADYESVRANARLLSLAFGLNPSDPNSMPVTRDLSPAKRAAILEFLKNPLLGEPGPAPGKPASLAASALSAPPPGAAPRGGKAAAAARRLVLRSGSQHSS